MWSLTFLGGAFQIIHISKILVLGLLLFLALVQLDGLGNIKRTAASVKLALV